MSRKQQDIDLELSRLRLDVAGFNHESFSGESSDQGIRNAALHKVYEMEALPWSGPHAVGTIRDLVRYVYFLGLVHGSQNRPKGV